MRLLWKRDESRLKRTKSLRISKKKSRGWPKITIEAKLSYLK